MVGMFVKTQHTYRNGERWGPYYAVARSYLIGRKDTRHEIVGYVGKAQNKRHAEELARRMGYLCGAWGCNQGGDIYLKAQNGERIEFKEDGGVYPAKVCTKHQDQWLECEGDPERGYPLIVPFSIPNKPREIAPRKQYARPHPHCPGPYQI
jgi:hypothetical protein